MRYRLTEHLIPMKEGESFSEYDIRIEIVTREEMVNSGEQFPHKKSLLHMLDHIRYCRAEVFGPCMICTLAFHKCKTWGMYFVPRLIIC